MEAPLRSYSKPTSTRPVLPHHLPTVSPPQKNRGEMGKAIHTFFRTRGWGEGGFGNGLFMNFGRREGAILVFSYTEKLG